MKIIVQRSKASRVRVDKNIVGEITSGLVLLVCFESGDKKELIAKSSEKILNLRCFQDDAGKMNRNILEAGGEILAISQFTLSWDGSKGNRPGFDKSLNPNDAKIFFKLFCERLREKTVVKTGEFGASMDVEIINDGPVTFSLSF